MYISESRDTILLYIRFRRFRALTIFCTEYVIIATFASVMLYGAHSLFQVIFFFSFKCIYMYIYIFGCVCVYKCVRGNNVVMEYRNERSRVESQQRRVSKTTARNSCVAHRRLVDNENFSIIYAPLESRKLL